MVRRMEMPLFSRTWHGIDLTNLPGARSDRVVGTDFYSTFYRALESTNRQVEAGWLAGKRNLGLSIEESIIQPWATQHSRNPEILAVAAGMGIVEGVWAEKGHRVTFNDCQENSLKALRTRFPEAEFLIGDVSSIPIAMRFDLITIIGLDYCFDRNQFARVLAKVRRSLQPGGRVIVCCMNILSWRQVAAETVKLLTGKRRGVFWGYWRTPGEFFWMARQSGLAVEGIHRFKKNGLARQARAWRRLIPLHDSNLLVVFK